MRRSGKTTRLVDYAVQQLFDGKKLFFPSRERLNTDIKRDVNSLSRPTVYDRNFEEKTKKLPIIDQDGIHGMAQEYLLRQFLNRLQFEHQLYFKGKPEPGGTTVQLSDFKQNNQ